MRPTPSDRSPTPLTAHDDGLIWAIALLLSVGFVMVYSASIAYAEADPDTHNRYFYLIRHGVYLTISLIVSWIVFHIPSRIWQEKAPYLFVGAFILLILVLVPGIGKVVNGSRRWINLVVLNLQPSELMKLAVVLYAANYTVRKADWMHSFSKGFLPMAVAVIASGALLLLEPDFGAFTVIAAIAMGTLFLGGINGRIFAALSVVSLGAFVVLIISSPYRLQRVTGFMDPWQDPYGKGYQLSHSLIAFGRGEWLGVGLGGSVEKLFYLPEAHTDFLMAVIAEECGFIGIVAVVGLFAYVVRRAFMIGVEARKQERYFQSLVAQGVGIWLAVQSFINIGVNMGLLPTKGLTLPLLSYGGSALLANCSALAIVLRIDWENRQTLRGYKV
ncbi:putative lipid II flippase FtsW [Aquaspirillum sp. LM1]|nr:putative lipid II flippase FtsW [Aquaspirillum sp. LM1]